MRVNEPIIKEESEQIEVKDEQEVEAEKQL